MSLIDAATAADLAERPLAGDISQDALEAICSKFGEDKSTLVDLYQAAKDENELLEFKNYELQFKIQELEFKQSWKLGPTETETNAKICDREQTQPANQCQLLDEQKATATSGTPTTNLQPQVAPAAERASAPKRSDNNGQRPTGQAAVGAQSTSVNFEHENDDLNNAPNESGNKRRRQQQQLALSRIVGASAREPPQQQQQCEPVTSERANNENIESGRAGATTSSSSSPSLATATAAAVNQTKNGISFARSTAMNAASSGQQQHQALGQCQLAGETDANERGQSPEDAAADSCGRALAGNKVEHDEQVDMGARKTNISTVAVAPAAGDQPQTNDAPDCCASSLSPPAANQWPGGMKIEYNDQRPTDTCCLEQPTKFDEIPDSTRSESLATSSLVETDQQVSSSLEQTEQSTSDKQPATKLVPAGMARIAKPVQRGQVSGVGAKAKSNATAANRSARNRTHSITSGSGGGGSRSSSAASAGRQAATAAVNKSAPATTRTNPMRVRSKSSLADQRTLACSVNQRLQRQSCGDSSSSPSGAASISLHLHRRLGGSSLQLQQQQPVRQLISRSVSTSRVCTGTSSSSSSSSSQAKPASNKWPASAIKRSLTTGNFVTHSVSQIPTLIDQSHAKLRRPSHGNGSASARLKAVASQSSLLLMGAADHHDEPNDERDQLSKSLGNLLGERPMASVAPEARGQSFTSAAREQPVGVHTFSKSCVQMNEIANVSSSSSAKQLVPPSSAKDQKGKDEEINQTESAGPASADRSIGANDEAKRAASCLQCKLFESKLDLLGRERTLLSEQLSELEEMENDSRLASQKLAAQVGALEQQLDQCKFELARSCDSESKLRFQNKRLHFELRQRQECVQSLQQQLNELRSRARALFRLHRESKHQRAEQSVPTDSAGPPSQKTSDGQESRPPSRRASLVVDSCASSQTYDSAYSKSSSSSSSSGSSSSAHSEVDCCEEETEEPPQQERQQHEKIETADSQLAAGLACEPAKVNGESCTSSSCDESEHVQEEEEGEGEKHRQQTVTAIEIDAKEREQPASEGGHCLTLANRQQVLKKRISIARILRGIQVQQQQQQQQPDPEQPGQLSISDDQRARVDQCAQAAAVNGCQTARIARVDQQQRELARALAAQTNQSGEQSNQTSSGQLSLPPADGHRDGLPPVKQQRRPAQSGGKSPIELALEGVSELERTLAADEALQSLCQTSYTGKQGDEASATKAEGESSGESSQVAATPAATSATCQLIDGLKSEVSNLQMRLMQANTLNDNLILELKSQQRRMSLTESGGQQKGQAANEDGEPRERSLSLVNATGQHKEQPGAHPKSSSVIYVNGLNASVTHHHHHYEPPVLPPRPHQQLVRPNQQAVDYGQIATTTTTATAAVNNQATYCHNCCHTNRRQFHAATTAASEGAQHRQQSVQRQQYRRSTGAVGHHFQQQCERELADFLKFLQEKLHFHHGRTFELVNECQKLAMNALLASYNQRVSLAHHQRVVLMGNQAAAASAVAHPQQQQQQQQRQCFIESTSELLPPVRPPPRRRTRVMVIGQQPQQPVQHSPMGFVGQPAAATADTGHSMTRADQNNNNTSFSQAAPPATTATTTPSALQVAKQTLFSLVPIYYSSSSSCNKQQQANNNKEEATMKSSQATGGLASEWTNKIQLASDQSNSMAAAQLEVINAGQQQQQQQQQLRQHRIASDQYHHRPAATTQVQINGTNDIYATVSRTPGQGAARQANRVSILKISGGRNDLAQTARTTNIQIASGGLNQQQFAQGDIRSQPRPPLHAGDHHRLGSGGQQQQQQGYVTINQVPAKHQHQHQRPGQLLASVKDALSEEIERFRVHANGQLLDLLTRQNWCESLVTEKLKAIETRHAQHWQGSDSGGNTGQASKSISLQLQATNYDILRLDNLTSPDHALSGDKIHMLDRSTLYCNGVKMTQSSRPSSINVPTKTISQSVSLNGVPQQQLVHGISRPDCSVTDSLC